MLHSRSNGFETRDARSRKVQVLLVDDDTAIRMLLTDKLVASGYCVTSACCAEDALGLIRSCSYDIIFSDVYMPAMNGFQFTRSVARIHPQIPIVVMTSFGDIATGRQALECGACDFITKPIDVAKLPLILENNLKRKKIEARRLSEERGEVLFKAIKALAAAIDAKSHYTGRHSARVAELCVELGVEMGMDRQAINTLELAAHIHDVGKIGTPDAVLMKNGKLTTEERAEILKHPAIGADFLAGIDELQEVADIVRHHHEHMDGSGYPDGLRGEAIPLLARMLTVGDAYEAMTADRPYRKANSWQSALRELRAHAGTQFDPVVVEFFGRTLRRMFERGDTDRMAA